MKTHVELLGLVNIVSGLLDELVALFILTVFFVLAPTTGDTTGSVALIVIGLGVGGFLLVLGIPNVIAGIGLLRFRSWSRILALIVAVLGFFNFPLGTLTAIYAAWVLTNDETARLLGAQA